MALQNEFIVELLDFAPTHNCFQFSGTNYQQVSSTSMGAPWAPAYAGLHLGWWEEWEVFSLSIYLCHVNLWIRYIDNILVIW